jgi:hypothetical protein
MAEKQMKMIVDYRKDIERLAKIRRSLKASWKNSQRIKDRKGRLNIKKGMTLKKLLVL